MCGICGIIGGFGARTEPAVRAMMQAMVHRGPDDDGYEERPVGSDLDGAVAAFGFRRLAILDLTPAGHQPMVDDITGNCLVFNGEIYNFKHLRNKLSAQGVRFRSTGDTEVLLKSLTHWGEDAIDELDGMFAFAFYEARSRRVLLARDHLGIKPLYVAKLPRAVVFASEVRAVLASGLVPADLDQAGIATFLAYGAPQDPLTVHAAIRSLPAGTMQWFDGGVATGQTSSPPRRWWRFPQVGQPPPEAELIDRIQRVCSETVLEQCVADVPLVVFLSGGIDSATLAALAKSGNDRLLTFTVGNATSPIEDETAQARETADFLQTEHYETVVDDDWVRTEWQDWMLGADRPSVDGLNTLLVSRAVKAAGNTVALSGLGADELFGGYVTFDEVRRLRRMVKPAGLVPKAVRSTLVPQLARLAPYNRRDRIIDLFGGGIRYLDLALRSRRVHGDESLRRMGFDHRTLGLTDHWLPPEAYDAFSDVNRDLFHTVSQVETLLYMANTLLRDADVSSMSCSLETRVPFLGRRLVDLVGSIPGHIHFPPGPARKHLLRQLASRMLPRRVIERPKRGFHLPLTLWMNRPLREDCLASIERLKSVSAIDATGVHQAWQAGIAHPGHRSQSQRLSLVVLGSYLAKTGAATGPGATKRGTSQAASG
jgi:asparagine synthase (glutamine-hydrolysing)